MERKVTALASSVEVENEWAFISVPPPSLLDVDRDSCTRTLSVHLTVLPVTGTMRRRMVMKGSKCLECKKNLGWMVCASVEVRTKDHWNTSQNH